MEKRAKKREVTVKKLFLSDQEAQFDAPVPGTMAERLGLMEELFRMGLSIGGQDDQPRLQRHVTRLTRGTS